MIISDSTYRWYIVHNYMYVLNTQINTVQHFLVLSKHNGTDMNSTISVKDFGLISSDDTFSKVNG